MYIKKVLQVTLLAASLLTLAACSTTHGGAGADGANGAYGTDGGTSANGLGEGTNFDTSGNAFNNDPMKVGNQSYYFDFDKNDVRSSDMASIQVQAHYLATHPRAKVLITGNTDERGSREYNIGLGDRRANSVAAVLEADGVSKNQITTVSYGAEKPAALGHDEDSYAKNRRADLIYKN